MKPAIISQAEADQIRTNALTNLVSGNQLLTKSYLAELGSFDVQNVQNTLNSRGDVRIFHLSRLVLENRQSVLESATAAYTALGTAGYTVFFLLKSDGQDTSLYLGVRGEAGKSLGRNAGELLEQVMSGHFSGSLLNNQKGDKVEELLGSLENNAKSITAVTGIPSLSNEDKEHFVQGLEHFIDAAEGQKYQVLILAEPVSPRQLDYIRAGYEQVATQISPLLKQSLSFGQNESESVGLTLSKGLSESLGKSFGLTETKGTSLTITNTVTHGTSESHTEGTSSSISQQTIASKIASHTGQSIALTATAAGFVVAGPVGAMVGGAIGGIVGSGISIAFAEQETKGTNSSNTTGSSYSNSNATAKGESNSTARSRQKTQTHTITTNEASSETQTLGSSRQITLESVDKHIEQLLKRVDHQLERVEEARQYGAWHSATYVICENQAVSESLASIFLGILRGVNSSSEDFSLTTWAEARECRGVASWLKQLTHPHLKAEGYEHLNIPYFTPATLVSTKEMAIQLGLPRRSTSAVTVIETQSFGRKVQKANEFEPENTRKIHLGNIYHLWNEMKHSPISLNVDQLASHIFVTGSTGSGKSNTVYQLLNELEQHKIPFMVIEPAKGEYKHVFGHHSDVLVLGTNPQVSQLLKINPFKFPKGVHILEHIDRLIEIFNVCWPMYAAMPAILKDAMLTAYEISGWDLANSCNSVSDDLFPNFTDLLNALENVITSSAYSDEAKSNYIGSLVTRVRSLTNGLNGQIFSANEIDNTVLFDSKVIIDLSRVGSQETKSLIMGILVMRLSEHRMSNTDGMNQPLKHVTVLEEAHNILKRTSTEQSSEGSNVAGKAVEMLSNAIAEMRTYGEGFIIADQSPSAVDISAIRNTNTKIIMRLPDEADRQLAGKSAGVKDEQLEEIAKLAKGVAVVYQNDWLEPVLCKIHHSNSEEKPYEYKPVSELEMTKKVFNQHMADLLFCKKTNKQLDFTEISQSIKQSQLGVEYKNYFLEVVNRLEQNVVPPILEKDNDYLIDLYQRIIQQHIDRVNVDLSVEVQKHLASIM